MSVTYTFKNKASAALPYNIDPVELDQNFADVTPISGTWTPTWSGLTVIGTLTSEGTYVKIGRLLTVVIKCVATTSTASTANITHVDNLPFSANPNVGNCIACDTNTTSYGVGVIGGINLYTPTWAATGLAIYITSSYLTAT